MRAYIDSSALLKRVFREQETIALADKLDQLHEDAALVVSSSLSWVEVARALRRQGNHSYAEVADEMRTTFLGVAEYPLDTEVMTLARRIGESHLRSLDAIHLAVAIHLDADIFLAYDTRLADSARHSGLSVCTPGG